MTLTILQTADAKKLAKTFTPTSSGWEKLSYDSATYFNVIEETVASIADLSGVLTEIESDPNFCVIRGRRKPGMPIDRIKRRLHDRDGERATFEEQSVSWVMLDIDGLPADPQMTNQDRLGHITAELPICFREATYHYQWSSQAGLDGWHTLRAHLYFWLEHPIRCSDLRAQATAEGWGVDYALFNPVQIHYTAAPIFTNCNDPLSGIRSGLVRKTCDTVSLPYWERPKPIMTLDGPIFPPTASFAERLAAIGPNYHLPILSAAACYVGQHGLMTDTKALRALLVEAILNAEAGRNPKSDYLDSHYLDRVIDGAMAKFASTSRANGARFTRLGL